MKIDYKGKIDQRSGREHVGLRVIPGKRSGHIVVLRPGVNVVEDADWEEIKDHRSVVSLMAIGMLSMLEPPGAKAKHKVTDLPVYEAMAMVKRTTDPVVLGEWVKQLERSPLLDSADLGTFWRSCLDDARKQLTEATTDDKGQPATPRQIRLGSEAA